MIDIEKEIAKNYPKLKNNKIIKGAISKFADAVIHQKEINDFLKQNAHLNGFEFVDAVLEHFNFDFTVSENDMENIPPSGRVVIIANHPLGGLDGLALLKLVGKVRKDVKIIANDFLQGFSALEPLMHSINNFQKRQSKESINGIYEALNKEEAIIVFPAGEVSRAGATGVKDKKWSKGFLNFASRTNSPILPLFVGGKNSKTFYSVSAINKSLATLLLSHEMFKQRDNSIDIKIGELIPYENIVPKGLQKEQLVKLYKKQVYGLRKNRSYFETQSAIAHPENVRDIKKELEAAQLLGETKDGKKIYLYESGKDSSLIKELGRLRELSFRKVGEGANKRRDIDKYDSYYKHIVLFDEGELEVVGAYRIGESERIVREHGIEGLYTSTLFEFEPAFSDKYLKNSIELGRSFVQPKYWGSRALDYLWQGIGAYLRNNPHIEYMYGPVSLSGTYPKVAKDIILSFYDCYFGAKECKVKAKLPYNFKNDQALMKNINEEFSCEDYRGDFKRLRKMLVGLEVSVPVLYKQYSELCEQGGIEFCAYNVDPDFSECIDSFIVVDIGKIKQSQHKRYIGEKRNFKILVENFFPLRIILFKTVIILITFCKKGRTYI